jgi:hypothetical protein
MRRKRGLADADFTVEPDLGVPVFKRRNDDEPGDAAANL